MIKLIGILDGIIGLDYWVRFFQPNLGSVVDHSSQGRFFCFYVKIIKMVINGNNMSFLDQIF